MTVFSDLASKSIVIVSSGLASKPAVTVSRFGPQNRWLRFVDLCLKITATVSWFGTQNQAGFNLSVVPQNRRRDVGAGHASRSSGLLRAGHGGWCTWHHHRDCVGVKSKTDESMRQVASDPAILILLFSFINP
jgi:hypothetical protein